MLRIVNLARIVTSLLLILVLLFVYANLPSDVGLLYNESGLVAMSMERDTFFYLTLLVSLVINLLVVVFVKVFDWFPVSEQRVFFKTAQFKEAFLIWLNFLAPVMNLFFILSVAMIGIHNNGDLQLIGSYGYLAYLGQFLVVGWLIYLVVIISKMNYK